MAVRGKKTNIVDYLSLKYLHMCFAGLSGGFFLVRGAWMLAGSPLLQRRWVRTVPHLIDTALLSTAVALAVWSSQYPLAQTWLTAKVLALISYIVLGTIALPFSTYRSQVGTRADFDTQRIERIRWPDLVPLVRQIRAIRKTGLEHSSTSDNH